MVSGFIKVIGRSQFMPWACGYFGSHFKVGRWTVEIWGDMWWVTGSGFPALGNSTASACWALKRLSSLREGRSPDRKAGPLTEKYGQGGKQPEQNPINSVFLCISYILFWVNKCFLRSLFCNMFMMLFVRHSDCGERFLLTLFGELCKTLVDLKLTDLPVFCLLNARIKGLPLPGTGQFWSS